MPDTTPQQRDRAESWVVPITCVVIGVAYLLVGILRDETARRDVLEPRRRG